MFRALTCVLLCTLCWSTTIAQLGHAQDPQQITEVDFRVKSVGLGSSHSLVLRQLGRPISSKRQKIPDDHGVCGPAYTLFELRYNGAVIELHGDLSGRNFEVASMEITSPKFLIAPGIRIGRTEAETRSKLGEPIHERTEPGSRVLYYVTKDNLGGAGLYFRNGQLVKVNWNYTLC